jgi:hypothetical protein
MTSILRHQSEQGGTPRYVPTSASLLFNFTANSIQLSRGDKTSDPLSATVIYPPDQIPYGTEIETRD